MNTTEYGVEGSCLIPIEERIMMTQVFDMAAINFAPIPPPASVKIVLWSVYGLIFIVGLTANILLTAWITFGKPKRTRVDAYVISLSITDLILALTFIPMQMVLIAFDSNWLSFPSNSASALCKTTSYVQTASIYICLLSLIVIAIDRYWAICHPLFHYKLKEKKRTITICCTVVIWMIGLLVAVDDAVTVRLSLSVDDLQTILESKSDLDPSLFTSEIIFVPDMDYYEESKELIPGVKTVDGNCQDLDVFRACKANKHVSNIVFLIIMFVIPQSILGFCYTRISYCLWIRKPLSDSSQPSDQRCKIKKSTRKITIVMMVTVIIFGLLWLPYWIKKVYDVNRIVDKTKPVTFDAMDMIFTICTHICIISSPITYLAMDREFWKKVNTKRQLLMACIKPKLRFEAEDVHEERRSDKQLLRAIPDSASSKP